MNRIDRLMGIITHLQAKKHLTVVQIAEQFDISERTVFRDLKAIGEIGVPVNFEEGKGYFVGNGYFLPPVSLTVEEANALSLAEPLVVRFADKSIQEHFWNGFDEDKNGFGAFPTRENGHHASQCRPFCTRPLRPSYAFDGLSDAVAKCDYQSKYC